MKEASKRFLFQAKEMKFYDQIYIYDENELDKDFYSKLECKFELRGFGYWSWKPQIIIQTFEKMNYGDILQYTDIGCHLNKEGKKRLRKYFEIANQSKKNFLVFKMVGFPERKWTKGDVFEYFNFRSNKNIVNTDQFWAGAFIVKKTLETEKIIKEWRDIILHNFNLIDDSDSISPNFSDFIENRHDQSIFSLISKKYKFTFLEHGIENTKYFAKYPILALRDRGYNNEWIKTMAMPPIKRIFYKEKIFHTKVKYLMQLIIGQKMFRLIRNFLLMK